MPGPLAQCRVKRLPFGHRQQYSRRLSPTEMEGFRFPRQLPKQTRVLVLEMNGTELYSAVLQRSYDAKLYCEELLRYILRLVHLPHCCAVIHWRVLTTEESIECTGTLVWKALNEDEYEALNSHANILGLDDSPTVLKPILCGSCCLPCKAADVDDTRHEDCVRCWPCWMCSKCILEMPGEPPPDLLPDYYPGPKRTSYPVCFLCLKHDDVQTVLSQCTPLRRRRLCVLRPDLFLPEPIPDTTGANDPVDDD